MFEPKLTAVQRAQIFERALKGERVKDLANEYNVSRDTIERIKYDKKKLMKAKAAADAHMLYAQLRVHQAALKGVEKEHEILDRVVPEGEKGTSLLYLQHQVATSMMDRDGMKAVDKSETKVAISFSGEDIPLGMPPKDEEAGEG